MKEIILFNVFNPSFHYSNFPLFQHVFFSILNFIKKVQTNRRRPRPFLGRSPATSPYHYAFPEPDSSHPPRLLHFLPSQSSHPQASGRRGPLRSSPSRPRRSKPLRQTSSNPDPGPGPLRKYVRGSPFPVSSKFF